MPAPIPLAPFLTQFATSREEEPAIGGRYCDTAHVWLIEVDGVERPIVQTDAVGSELLTKTRVLVEDDDEDWSAILELTTKTKVVVEEDDEEAHGLALLEMLTKTFAQVESDDDDFDPRNRVPAASAAA